MKIDAKIFLDLDDPGSAAEMLALLKAVGYGAACVEVSAPSEARKVRRLNDSLPIALFTRKTITANNRTHLFQELKKFWGAVDYISVFSRDVHALETALRDSRVSALASSVRDLTLKVTPGIASLAKQGKKLFEISFGQVLAQEGIKRTKIIRKIAKNVSLLGTNRILLALCSEASDPTEILAPMHLVSIAREFFKIPLHKARKALTVNVLDVLNENKMKKSPAHVMEGVRVIKPPHRK